MPAAAVSFAPRRGGDGADSDPLAQIEWDDDFVLGLGEEDVGLVDDLVNDLLSFRWLFFFGVVRPCTSAPRSSTRRADARSDARTDRPTEPPAPLNAIARAKSMEPPH